MLSKFLCAGASVLLLLVGGCEADEVLVTDKTSGAIFVGDSNGQVDSFKGIHYASFAKRFAVATEDQYSRGKRYNATEFGSPCFQPPPTDPTEPAVAEDCLFINVYRPHSNSSSSSSGSTEKARESEEEEEAKEGKLLPVAVWIHGGGFTAGSGSLSFYDGSKFALLQEEGFVVVTLNYRLGPLGFLCVDDQCNGGLNGLMDQITALEWVQHHIASFGGDPKSVSVFGESAGSLSICALAVSPAAKGLFHRAVLQSGACIGNDWGPGTTKEGVEIRQSFLKDMGAVTVDELTDTTKFPMDKFVWPAAPLGVSAGGPCVGGRVLPSPPLELYEKGDLNVQDMIIGGNTFDGLATWVSPTILPKNKLAYDALVTSLFARQYNSAQREAIIQQYDPVSQFNGSFSASVVQMTGDNDVVCPSLQLANLTAAALAKTGGKVYYYEFAHLFAEDVAVQSGVLKVGVNDSEWTSHAGEMVFVFGQTKGPAVFPGPSVELDVKFTASEECLFERTSNLWASFMKSGTPTFTQSQSCSAPHPGSWPSFDPAASRVTGLRLAADRAEPLEPDFRAAKCGSLFKNIAPK